MVSKSLHLFLLLIVLLPPLSLSVDEFNDDVLGLIVFKAALTDPFSRLSSWTDTDDTPCKWTGVTCDPNTTRVTQLQLDSLSLSGPISARGLLRLQSLRHLSLSNNNLSGPIPPDLSRLWSLQSVDFSSNSLSGPLPPHLFQQCASLTSVSFANNRLSGQIPLSLTSCMTLHYLNLSSNQLQGPLPDNIWSVTNLQDLDLSANSLSGDLPPGLANMYALRSISLAANSFSGGIPRDIGSCSTLESVDFGRNNFSGGIPDSLKNLNSCRSLLLNRNSLSGELPNWLGQMHGLHTLDLSSNGFYGRIPATLGNIPSLNRLNLSSNGFLGDLPDSLKNALLAGGLVSIDVSRNLLAGDLPNWLFDSDTTTAAAALHTVSLAGNRFTGTIHFPPSSNPNLQVLDLSDNAISGVIPSEIGQFTGLLVLNLSTNSLFGAIPATIGNLNFTRLLDLSANRLNGTIPPDIQRMDSLTQLSLHNNLLSGTIPPQIANCSSLTTLNLSANNLTGSIPPTFANLTNLHTVDLSRNNLSGSLPKELTNLSQLISFNVSHNDLQGELPVGGFFNTIPMASVSGNPSLCGSIFNKTCPATHPKPIVLNPNSSSDDHDDQDGSLPSTLHRKKLVLSISALIAIGAAAFILLGVVAVSVLNLHARNSAHHSQDPVDFLGKDAEFGHQNSPGTNSEYGKLVMFSGEADFGSSFGAQNALLSKDCEIGRGGFGAVYLTTLGDGDGHGHGDGDGTGTREDGDRKRSVAIKKLSISNLIKSQEDFEREVKRLGKVKHPNLVPLQGYYWTQSLQLLINEYVSGGSLYNQLHRKDDDYPSGSSSCLSWSQRFSVITGVAKGLAHLHQMNIIHYNIKSTNVLLDTSYEPKVGDFGLARLLPMVDRYILSSKIQSALGYMAPEFACRTVKITEKCDVYGFGVLVLETVTGKKPVEYMEDDVIVLCDMIREALEEGTVEDCVDKRLQGNYPADEVIPVIKLGLICASQVPSNRPDMAEVVNILELIGCPEPSASGGGREDCTD